MAADRAEDGGDDQAARERDGGPGTVVPEVQEARELDHADDHDDRLQPHVVADWTGLQSPDQDEYEYRQADQEIHAVRRP